MVEENGRLNWLREDMQSMRSEMKDGFDGLSARLTALESARSEQKGVLRPFVVILQLVAAAFVGWLATLLPGR